MPVSLFKNLTLTLLLVSMFLLPTSLGAAAAVTSTPLTTFNYKGVRLTDGHWQKQQQEILEYYLSIPTDNYVIGFRKRAGKIAPGTELGGWYSEDRFNSFGQIVSGLARMYAATGDERAKQ